MLTAVFSNFIDVFIGLLLMSLPLGIVAVVFMNHMGIQLTFDGQFAMFISDMIKERVFSSEYLIAKTAVVIFILAHALYARLLNYWHLLSFLLDFVAIV